MRSEDGSYQELHRFRPVLPSLGASRTALSPTTRECQMALDLVRSRTSWEIPTHRIRGLRQAIRARWPRVSADARAYLQLQGS